MVYRIKNKKKKILWPILVLKYCLPLFSFGFFGQIFLLFTTIFYCRKTESSTSPYLKCRPGHWFNDIKPIAGIATFLHFLISFITNTLYYKPIFIPSDCDLLKKSNTLPDVIFLFVKMIIITTFILDKGKEYEHWAILSILIFITGAYAYFTLSYKNRQNKVLLYLNNMFCVTLFSGFFILLIGKVFKFLEFNGGIFLFFSSLLMIILLIIFFKKHEIDEISVDYKNIPNKDKYFLYVNHIYNIIKNKNNSRNNSTLINSLITYTEYNCIIEDCPLKKYIFNIKKGVECDYLLLQFCDDLFQYGISKYKDNIFLKNQYCIFLIYEMNNKKKALFIMESIKDEYISLQTNYDIYRCKKIIDNYISPFVNKNNSQFYYTRKSQEFQISIEEVTLLYYDFICFLVECKMQKINNFERINIIGNNIKKLNKKIEQEFNELINIKTDNIEIINLYSEFVENVLIDEGKIEECQNLKNIIYNKNLTEYYYEKDYSNFNMKIIKDNCNLHYLTISTKNKYFGYVLDCSTSLSKIFGYEKKELIGNHINILIPEIYHQKHNLFINRKTEENKLNFLEGLYKNNIYYPEFIQKDIFCITKSKFLIPLNIKIYLVNTEENDLIFFVEFINNIPLQNDLVKRNNNSSKYCILTDKNFIIQSFTPNCINFLNMTYEDLNSNINILDYIKQFREEYLHAIKISVISKCSQIKNTGMFNIKNSSKIVNKNINNHISNNIKQKIRNDLFNKNYNKRCKIIWNSFSENFFNYAKNELTSIRFKNLTSLNKDDTKIFGNNKLLNQVEKHLYMEPKKIIFDKELIGYYFYFSKVFNFENRNYLNYKIIQSKESDKNVIPKALKKYQVIIKSQNSLIDNTIHITGISKNKLIHNYEFDEKKIEINNNKSKTKHIIKMTSKMKLNEKEGQKNFEKRKTTISKYCSSEKIPNIYGEEIIINDEFIPNCPINFAFNLNNISFQYSNDKDNIKILNEQLKIEAENILNKYTIIRKKKNRNKSESFISSSNSKSESIIESEEYSSSIQYSESDLKSSNRKSTNISKNKSKLKNTGISKKNDEEQINEKNNSENDGVNDNNYYKVNLDNIYLMIYDFQRDVIVEEKNYKKISNVEKIMNDYKKKIDKTKDESYPFITFENNNNKKIKLDKRSSNENINIKNLSNNHVDNDKILKLKIIDAINNYKDEKPIKKLKLLTVIAYFIIIFFGILNTIHFLGFYSKIKEIFYLIRNTLYIQYYNYMSVYYIRELILLNFDIEGLEEVKYIKIPAKNKEEYISLIKNKLFNVFIENQSSIKTILTSSLTFSKITLNYFSECIIDIDYLSFNFSFETMECDIYTFLMQYNNAYYNLVFSEFELIQNHSDVISYIHNSFNGYRDGINELLNVYNIEQLYVKRSLISALIIYLIIILILLIIFYYFGINFFFASDLLRVNYIEIFYSINSEILGIILLNCLKVINKLKSNKEKKNESEEEIETSKNNEINKNNFLKNLNGNSKEDYVNDSKENKNNKSLYNINKSFLFFYGLFLLLVYAYFIYICIYIYKIFIKSVTLTNYMTDFIKFQYNIIDMFNVYREYIFDNQTIILKMSPYEYLITIESQIYETTTKTSQNTYDFLGPYNQSDSEVFELFRKPYCSYRITDYFNSSEECEKKFGNVINLDFFNFINYLIDQMRNRKNVIKYNLENKNIIGNLTEYKFDNIINDLKNNNNNNQAIFRFNLYNEVYLHSDLNILFFNLHFQVIQSIINLIMKLITIDGKDFYFILSIILYIFVLSIIFFACFLPLIRYLNKQIYRAKNMLSIIPINVLIYKSKATSLTNLFIDKN